MLKWSACFAVVVTCLAWLPGAAAEEPPPRTAVVGIDFEPPCLNPLLDGCNVNSAHWIAGSVLAGAYRERPDFVFEPVLVERVDVAAGPFTLTYHVRPDAVWSDGTPVTSDDFLYTLDAVRDPGNASTAARQRYADVTGAERIGAKTFRLAFGRVVADWRRLFDVVLPKHVLEGHDLDAVFRTGIVDPDTGGPIGSGPFLFGSWTRGASLTLTANPRWWGATGPFLDTVVFRPLPDPNQQFQGIRDGTLDVIYPQPQVQIADVAGLDGVVVDWREGSVFEHVDLNVASATMPLLRERWFRQAVLRSLDRATAVAPVYQPGVPAYPVLQSLRYRLPQPEYVPTYAGYAYDRAAVASLMTGNGCALGGDGIWVCGGVRASVRFATTTGNAVREQLQAALIASARDAGIELVPDNAPASVLLVSRLPAGQYEAIMFAWVTQVGTSPRNLYTCGGASNSTGYCSPPVDELIGRAEGTIDPAARAALYNQAYGLLAADAVTIPLLARPLFQVRRDRLAGPRLNPQGSQTWNIETWRIAGADVTPPTVTCAATPARIWLHNGKLVPVEVDVEVTDEGSGSAGFVLKSVSSDEPGEGDVQDFAVGTADTAGRIRAERDPEGDGRTYTFVYEGADLEGNTATCETTVEIVRRKRGS
jgi:peptide/nickel transport system substrate-binding protein